MDPHHYDTFTLPAQSIETPPLVAQGICDYAQIACLVVEPTPANEIAHTPEMPAQELTQPVAVELQTDGFDLEVLTHAGDPNAFGPATVGPINLPILGPVTLVLCEHVCPVPKEPEGGLYGSVRVRVAYGDQSFEQEVPVLLGP
jgi:hypothetical protein